MLQYRDAQSPFLLHILLFYSVSLFLTSPHCLSQLFLQLLSFTLTTTSLFLFSLLLLFNLFHLAPSSQGSGPGGDGSRQIEISFLLFTIMSVKALVEKLFHEGKNST